MDPMIIFIAFGLAMDSFSVSITNGLLSKEFITNKALLTSVFFGFFQAIMPVIGWLMGTTVADLISDFDHLVAFGLLSFIGFRMIYESIRKESNKFITSINIKVLFILSIATSIDALAVGLSLSFLNISILIPAFIIGIITFSLSFLGVFVGSKFGNILKNRVEILGGLILIVIGLKVFLEHTGVL